MIARPDFSRTIVLPGAGPCPRPVDLDRANTGFRNLVSLRVYRFAAGVAIDGAAEGDEVLLVLLGGAADVALHRGDLFAGEHRLRGVGDTRALYLPPDARYRLTATTDCDVAYARARPDAAAFPAPAGFGGAGVVDHALGMTLHLTRLTADAAFALPGDTERFVHLRAHGGATGRLASGERLADWDTAVLTAGTTLSADGGAVDALVIAAR